MRDTYTDEVTKLGATIRELKSKLEDAIEHMNGEIGLKDEINGR